MQVLAGIAGLDGYEQLVALLSDRSKHEVLKKGTRLGKQLAEGEEEEAAWRVLVGFWSTTIDHWHLLRDVYPSCAPSHCLYPMFYTFPSSQLTYYLLALSINLIP